MLGQIIGWGASIVLVLTLAAQVVKQWKAGTKGVSRWLFIGQLAASSGFVAYSALRGDPVFIVTNVLGLLAAVAGIVTFVRDRRRGWSHSTTLWSRDLL